MNKKVIIIVCAVVAFFLGAVLLDQFPIIGSLVPLFEICVGGYLGYLWGKNKFKGLADYYEAQCVDFKGEFVNLENEVKTLKTNLVLLQNSTNTAGAGTVTEAKSYKKAKKQSK